jgi:hypothetical protein
MVKAMKSNLLRQSLAVSAACACLVVPVVAVAQEAQENTATGVVLSVLGPGDILEYNSQNGVVTACEIWQVTLISLPSGQQTVFHVESPTSGSVATGFTPTDPNAVQTASTLEQGGADGTNAVATVSYVASETVCDEIVTNVVTSASLAVAIPPAVLPRPTINPKCSKGCAISTALEGPLIMLGNSGELPQLLKHDGYTASYFPIVAGTVNVCWELGPNKHEQCGPKTPSLAFGHAVYRRAIRRWTHFKVRLTKLGRMMLAHHSQLNVYPADEYTPLDGVGGIGAGPSPCPLSANLPTQAGDFACF